VGAASPLAHLPPPPTHTHSDTHARTKHSHPWWIVQGVSENIILGQMCPVGTGSFDLMVDQDKLAGEEESRGGKGGRRGGCSAAQPASSSGSGEDPGRGWPRRARAARPAPCAGGTALSAPPSRPATATRPLPIPLPLPLPDAIELDYAYAEDALYYGAGPTPAHMTPGRSPGMTPLRLSPGALMSPGAGQSPFSDNVLFSPMGDSVLFSPGPGDGAGYRCVQLGGRRCLVGLCGAAAAAE
jgi:hypothetical protein